MPPVCHYDLDVVVEVLMARRHSFGQFLATLSNPGKSLLVLDLGTLTLSGVNKYNDSVVEYRYINTTTGYLQSVLFAYNDKVS